IFFFQAEDGIRDDLVTGVQTCALPILTSGWLRPLIPPQNDRSKPTGSQSDPFLHMGVVRETSEGPVIRGARMLATLGPVADEVRSEERRVGKEGRSRVGRGEYKRVSGE